MKRGPALLLIVCLTIAGVFVATTLASEEIRVVWIFDGDSFEALSDKGKIRVRLVGIDAPETSKARGQAGQPFSQKAKKRLISELLNKSVVLQSYGIDDYKRVLGVVYVNGRNINLTMIRAGLAEVYRGRPAAGLNLEPYRMAEDAARAARRGIWSLGEKYISPRTWRRTHSGGSTTSP